jgi:LmbE family N-acetylglucosaminyl deacetylase
VTGLDLDGIRGPVLIVAPHPDDESIGCGGLIAGLRQRNVAVAVVIMTDGAGSHPSSRSYPAPRLAALREAEAREALSILSINSRAISFWRFEDRYLPSEGADFDRAVERARAEMRALAPTLLVLPGRTDAHGDHRASWAIWTHAASTLPQPPRVLDYVVWPGPERPGGEVLTLDIAAVLPLKRRAIAAHRSQHGLVIADDPGGFTLPPDLLARTRQPVEVYFEATP